MSTPPASHVPSTQLTCRQRPNIFLRRLPGEIRNQIYELCVPVFSDCSQSRARTIPIGSRLRSPKFSITALQRWTGQPVIRITSPGPLPLLFTNKQIYNEISTLIYSRIDNITIGGYIMQYPAEDLTSLWDNLYTALEILPGLLKYTKTVTVKLPSVREDLFSGHFMSLGLIRLQPRALASSQSRVWGVIPSLLSFLRKFERLETLKILMTVEGRLPPDLELLLGFYDVGSGKVPEIYFEGEGRQKWVDKWNECITRKENEDLEKALIASLVLKGVE